MKVFKSFCCFILSIILFLSAAVFQISVSLKHDLFSYSFYTSKFQTYQIYDKLEKSIDYELSTYADKYKLPSAATENMISNVWVEQQCNTIINQMVQYMSRKSDTLPVLDTKTPEDNFNKNLVSILKRNNIPVDRLVTTAQTQFYSVFELVPFSSNWNEVNGDKFKDTVSGYRKYVPYFNYAPYASAAVMIACAILIFLICKRLVLWKLWTGYSLILSGLGISFSGFIIANTTILSNFVQNTVVIPQESIFSAKMVYPLVTDILSSLIMAVGKYGAMIAFLGLLIIVITSLFDREKNNVFMYHKPLK